MRVYGKAQIKTPLFTIGLISMLLKISPFDFLKILKVAFSKFEFGCPYPPSQGQCFTEVAGPEPILHPVMLVTDDFLRNMKFLKYWLEFWGIRQVLGHFYIVLVTDDFFTNFGISEELPRVSGYKKSIRSFLHRVSDRRFFTKYEIYEVLTWVLM